jgi:hypothetical protein
MKKTATVKDTTKTAEQTFTFTESALLELMEKTAQKAVAKALAEQKPAKTRTKSKKATATKVKNRWLHQELPTKDYSKGAGVTFTQKQADAVAKLLPGLFSAKDSKGNPSPRIFMGDSDLKEVTFPFGWMIYTTYGRTRVAKGDKKALKVALERAATYVKNAAADNWVFNVVVRIDSGKWEVCVGQRLFGNWYNIVNVQKSFGYNVLYLCKPAADGGQREKPLK